MSSASAGHRLATLLAPVVADAGLDLEAVEITPAGKRRQVRVLVDKDGGISLDDVALVSHSISTVLDSSTEADSLLGSTAYVLEVSSPGVDRPLVEPRHWRRAVGRLVRAPLKAGGEVRGRVLEASPDGVRISSDDPAASDDAGRAFTFADLGAGRIEIEFNRTASEPDDIEESP